MRSHAFDFAFVYLGGTDLVGHAHGWMSEPYLQAIGDADVLLLAPDSEQSTQRLDWVPSQAGEYQIVAQIDPDNYLAIQRKELVTLDSLGQMVKSEAVYLGKVSNSLQAVFLSPDQSARLCYFATESAISFSSPPRQPGNRISE